MKQTVLFLTTLLLISPAHAADWPEWLGPNGDSAWNEEGVITQIPNEGLTTKWESEVGLGYAGPAVANGRVFLMDYVREGGEIANNAGAPDQLSGVERILCLDAATGRLLWKHSYNRNYSISYGSGPRTTPTIVDDKVYTLGAEGDLYCFEASSGRVVWSKQISEAYGAKTPMWGHSAHPFIHQDTLYCIAGGDGSIVVALDRETGEEKWRALTASSQGYCPPTIITHEGIEQLIIWHPESLNSLNPRTGEVYWTEPLRPNFGGSIQAPRKQGSHLFVGGPGVASMFKLVNRDGIPGAEPVWKGNPRNAVYPVNSPIIFTEEAIFSVDSGTGSMISVNPEDGSRFWETAEPVLEEPSRKGRHGTAFLIRYQDSDTYYIINEIGDLVLAELTASGYKEIGRTNVIEPSNSTNTGGTRSVVWSHPAFANKTLFVRNDEKIIAIDLDAKSY
jgi:outer membrane protein assembly factor BamB